MTPSRHSQLLCRGLLLLPDTLYQSRRSSAWADVTGLVRGQRGLTGGEGSQARFSVYGYINATVAPTTAPASTTFVQSTNVLTLPTGYTTTASTPATGETVYRIEAVVNPKTDSDTVALVWSVPVELPAYLAANEAEDAADRAAASATAAAADAALVESYSGPAAIVEDLSFTSWDTDVTVASWRDYDLLAVTLLDSSTTAHTYQFLIMVDALDTTGKAQIAIEQNAEVEIIATDGSDVLNFDIGAGQGDIVPECR